MFTKLLDAVKEQMHSIWPPTPHNTVTGLFSHSTSSCELHHALQVAPLTGPQSTANSIMTGHLASDVTSGQYKLLFNIIHLSYDL